MRGAEDRTNKVASLLREGLVDSVAASTEIEVMSRPCTDRFASTWPPNDFCIFFIGDDIAAANRSSGRLQQLRQRHLHLVSSLVAMPVVHGFALPQLTIKVFDHSAIPSADEGLSWAEMSTHQTLHATGWDAANSVLGGLVTVSAVHILKSIRPLLPIEEQVREHAEEQVVRAVLAVAVLARAAAGEATGADPGADAELSDTAQLTVPGLVLAELGKWVASVAEEEKSLAQVTAGLVDPGQFAKGVSRAIRGENEELLNSISGANVLLLLNDVDPALARTYLAEDTAQ
jgi:hypothetical protein